MICLLPCVSVHQEQAAVLNQHGIHHMHYFGENKLALYSITEMGRVMNSIEEKEMQLPCFIPAGHVLQPRLQKHCLRLPLL